MLEKALSVFNMFSKGHSWTLVSAIILLVLLQSSQGGLGMKCESNKRKYSISLIDQNKLSCPTLFGDQEDKYCCTRNDGTMFCCDASDFLDENGGAYSLHSDMTKWMDEVHKSMEDFPTNFDTERDFHDHSSSIGFVVPVLVSLVVAMMVVCCVCCLCCPCCLWYKRRHRGTVYNNVPPVSLTVQPTVPQHGPHSDVYQQQPPPYPVMPMPQPAQHQAYPPVPPHGMPSQQQYPTQQPYPQQQQQQYPPAQYPPAVPPHGQQQPPPYNEVTSTQLYNRQSPYNPNF